MGIFSTLMGGSKTKQTNFSDSSSQGTSSSWNQAYPFLQDSFSSQVGGSRNAGNLLSTLLGFNGQMDQEQAYGLWRNTPGYQFALGEGIRGISGQRSGAGSFLSGDTLKALQKFGMGLADQTYGSYMDRLAGQQNLGVTIGNLLAGAGNRTESQETSTSHSEGESVTKTSNGIGGILSGAGSIMSGAAAISDRRLKKDITKLGELPNGLNVYEFTYIDGVGPCIGVMADEVAQVQPEALGPAIPGTDYKTVNYGLIEGLEQYA